MDQNVMPPAAAPMPVGEPPKKSNRNVIIIIAVVVVVCICCCIVGVVGWFGGDQIANMLGLAA